MNAIISGNHIFVIIIHHLMGCWHISKYAALVLYDDGGDDMQYAAVN